MNENEAELKEQPEPKDDQIDDSNKTVSPQSQKKSSYLSQYLQKMTLHSKMHFDPINNTLDSAYLPFNSLNYPKTHISKFSLSVVEESTNREVLILNATWGIFSVDIKILSIRGENTKHEIIHNSGTYGAIYRGQFNRKIFALKCLECKNKFSRNNAIKEWFLMKIGSDLEVGPKVEQYFGFDILMFEECIEFGMEICTSITQKIITNQLYENLSTMHAHNLIHNDIKPENIMFSPYFQRLVFIDYGLSTIIEQKIGERTFTNYVGSINCWGKQMNKCFTERKKMFVDLYYNDLHCLQATIQAHNSAIQSKIIFLEDQHLDGQSEYEEVNRFQYLNIVILKYYLYQKRFDLFQAFWNSRIKSEFLDSNEEYYRTQILYFLEEMIPNTILRDFFIGFVNDKYKETPIYTKLKIIYEISLNTICSAQILKNDDKFKYFSVILSQCLLEDDEKQINPKQNIAKFFLNKKIIKETSFINYLRIYLEYISYIDNRYQTQSNERQTVIKIYYEIFIAQDIQESISIHNIIEETIADALNRCIHTKNILKEQTDKIVYIFFQLYDFLLILDFGTLNQKTQWLQAIIQHEAMSQNYQILFIERIKQSTNISQAFPGSKKGMSRLLHEKQLMEWLNKKLQNLSSPELQISITRQMEEVLPLDFMHQFGAQIIQTYLIKEDKLAHNENTKNMIQLYYKLLSKHKRKKILFFLPKLNYNKLNDGDTNFGRQIKQIFMNNIRDDTLMSKMYFQILEILTKILNKNHKNPQQLKQDDFYNLQKKIQNIMIEDLYIFKPFFVRLVLRIKMCNRLDLRELKQQGRFVYRFYESFKMIAKQRVAGPKKDNCDNLISLYAFWLVSQVFQPSKESQVIQIIQDGLTNLKCSGCLSLLQKLSKIIILKKLLMAIKNCHQNKLTTSKMQQSILSFQNCYKSFCISISETIKQGQLSPAECRTICVGLSNALILCWQMPELQTRIHGCFNYYTFHRVFMGGLANLFQIQENNCFIYMVLQIFEKYSLAFFLEIIHQMCANLSQSFSLQHYGVLEHSLFRVLGKYSQDNLFNLFKALKNTEKQNRSAHYISLAYLSMLQYAKNTHLIQKLRSQILSKVDNLHHKFQRVIAVKLFGDRKRQITKKKLNHRQWIYNNNKLVKLLIVDHDTIPNKLKIKGSIFRRELLRKANKIRKYQQGKVVLKFYLK